jgi:hypothetical protein
MKRKYNEDRSRERIKEDRLRGMTRGNCKGKIKKKNLEKVRSVECRKHRAQLM